MYALPQVLSERRKSPLGEPQQSRISRLPPVSVFSGFPGEDLPRAAAEPTHFLRSRAEDKGIHRHAGIDKSFPGRISFQGYPAGPARLFSS